MHASLFIPLLSFALFPLCCCCVLTNEKESRFPHSVQSIVFLFHSVKHNRNKEPLTGLDCSVVCCVVAEEKRNGQRNEMNARRSFFFTQHTPFTTPFTTFFVSFIRLVSCFLHLFSPLQTSRIKGTKRSGGKRPKRTKWNTEVSETHALFVSFVFFWSLFHILEPVGIVCFLFLLLTWLTSCFT